MTLVELCHRVCLTAWLLLVAGVLLAELPEPDPLLDAPQTGQLTGRVTPAGAIDRLRAICRASGKVYQPSRFDARSGDFVFENLPGDAAYDLAVTTADGRQVEGIDLSFVDARLQRLADYRRRVLQRPDPAGPFTAADATALITDIRRGGQDDFMDRRRVLYLKGSGNRATALVELLRTRAFHDSARVGEEDDLVWRVELWYFHRSGGGWTRLANVERVLKRFRGKPDEWARQHVEYYPQLTGFIDRQGQSDPIHFVLPDKPDPSRGRVAGTSFNPETEPHVLLDATALPQQP